MKKGERVEDCERGKGKQRGERRGENEEADRGRKGTVDSGEKLEQEMEREVEIIAKRRGRNCKKKAEVEERRKTASKMRGQQRTGTLGRGVGSRRGGGGGGRGNRQRIS